MAYKNRSISLKPWEFNALLIEGVLLGATLVAATLYLFWDVLEGRFPFARSVGLGVAVVAVPWPGYPLLNAMSRARKGEGVKGVRFFLAVLASGLIVVVIHALLGSG